MRSRYSAFAVGKPDYLLATWHPATRPQILELDPTVRWTGLEILASSGGAMLSPEGTVEFRAHYVREGSTGTQHEKSRFVREDGQWYYLDGVSRS